MPSAPPATWRAVEAIPVFFLILMAAALAGLLAETLLSSCGARNVAATGVGEAMFAGVVLFWVRVVNHAPIAALGLPKRPLGDLGYGIVAGAILEVSAGLVLFVVQAIATTILGHAPAEPQQVDSCVRGVGLVFLGPVVVLLAPFGEELFFRGFLYKGLRRRRSVLASALISGFFFGLSHFGGLDFLLIIPSLMVVGIGLALVYEQRQSLLASMAAHATFNVVGFVFIVLGRR